MGQTPPQLDPTPLPIESPQPKIDPPRHDTRDEMKAVVVERKQEKVEKEKAKRTRPWKYGALVTALVTAVSAGGYGAKKSASTADATGQLSVRLDERSKNQQRTIDRHEIAIDEGRRAQVKSDKKAAVFRAEQRAVNQVLLDALRVPKSKRPKPEDLKPEADDEEDP